MKRILLIFFLALVSASASAQFSVNGNDPGSVRWMRMDSPNFRIIYPRGEDSLARVYGLNLEKARLDVSRSSGLLIGQNYRKGMPVVLHSFNTTPNASVVWAPRRMDMYTVKDPYAPTPIPWERLLSIHESRHVAQMQSGAVGRNRFMHYVFGEMFAGALAGIYAGPTILEGDAVVAETALTASGRGRQSAFFSYLMPAFDSGDWRDYWRWSYGSNKLFTPDHYRAGYMLVSGTRVFFDDPLFISDYFSRVYGKGLFLNLQKTVSEASGTSLLKAFRLIEDAYHVFWAEEAMERAPFMPSKQITSPTWRYSSYFASTSDGSGTWTLHSGLTSPTTLVRIGSDGSRQRVKAFSASAGDLIKDPANGRIWWSEAVGHWRWGLAGSTWVRFIETTNPRKVHTISKGKKYFNPALSHDGKLVCVTEYPSEGGSRLVLLNSSDGRVEKVIPAPDSLQLTESVWVGDRLFVAGLSSRGMSIYPTGDGRADNCHPEQRADNCHPEQSEGSIGQPLLPPQPVELSHLRSLSLSKGLSFLSDRTGVAEMYSLDVTTGELTQLTSTRYGIRDPFLNATADTLYYSALAPSDRPEAYRQGKMIYATAVKDLPMKKVSYEDIHSWKVADALSRQERELRENSPVETPEPEFSEPRRYSKILPTVHSWAPVYFNYDEVENASVDEYYRSASLGATALMQSLSGTGYGFLGYGLHEDPELKGSWRHSAHFKYVYSGLYPVFELSADLGDRAARDLIRVQDVNMRDRSVSVFTSRTRTSRPFFDGSLRVYLPVSFNYGGYSRGFIPQARLRITNDRINDRITFRQVSRTEDGETTRTEIGHIGEDHVRMTSTLDFSMRGYIIRDKAHSQVYPKFGIGAEVGLRARPGHKAAYSDMAYIYLYGYLPGILQDQGLKLTASTGFELRESPYGITDSPASFLPRGFVGTNLQSAINTFSPEKYRFCLDYSIPFLHVDWSGLCPVAYVKNFELAPFVDCSYVKFNCYPDYQINAGEVRSDFLASVGADLVVRLGNFIWLPYDTSFGIRFAHNSWSGVQKINPKGLGDSYFGMIFSVSL